MKSAFTVPNAIAHIGVLLGLVWSTLGCSPPALPFTDPQPEALPSPTAVPTVETEEQDRFTEQRLAMVQHQIRARDVSDPEVLRAMETVPRHLFVREEYLDQAYNDHPLPIGHGQTISQPYIVALMTELLELQPGDKVLEIGTGSGYQAAVLAELGMEVYTIEIIPELAEWGAGNLRRAGYHNVQVTTGDGYFGWEDHAPYDAIIVTAAPDHIPQPLVQQLKTSGKLVIPVGPPGGYQTLWQLTRTGDGPEDIEARNIAGVRFVPLVGGE